MTTAHRNVVEANQFLWLAKQGVQKPFAEIFPLKAFPLTEREKKSILISINSSCNTSHEAVTEQTQFNVPTLEFIIDS